MLYRETLVKFSEQPFRPRPSIERCATKIWTNSAKRFCSSRANGQYGPVSHISRGGETQWRETLSLHQNSPGMYWVCMRYEGDIPSDWRETGKNICGDVKHGCIMRWEPRRVLPYEPDESCVTIIIYMPPLLHRPNRISYLVLFLYFILSDLLERLLPKIMVQTACRFWILECNSYSLGDLKFTRVNAN